MSKSRADETPDITCVCGHDFWRHGWSSATFREGGCVVMGCKCEHATLANDDAATGFGKPI